MIQFNAIGAFDTWEALNYTIRLSRGYSVHFLSKDGFQALQWLPYRGKVVTIEGTLGFQRGGHVSIPMEDGLLVTGGYYE